MATTRSCHELYTDANDATIRRRRLVPARPDVDNLAGRTRCARPAGPRGPALADDGRHRDEAATDLWLEAGDSVDLADGLEVVMEAWPAARYQLIVPPSACATGQPLRSSLHRALGWLVGRVAQRPPALASNRRFAH